MEWYVCSSTGPRVVTAILICGLQTQPQCFTVRPQSHTQEVLVTHIWDLQLKTTASLVIWGSFRIRSHTTGKIQPVGQIRPSLQTRFL